MTNRVIHQEYLEAWLRGESVDFRVECGDFTKFCSISYELNVFDNADREFRITPKTLEVNLTDFYAEYDSINFTTDTEEFGIALTDLLNKYLPRVVL